MVSDTRLSSGFQNRCAGASLEWLEGGSPATSIASGGGDGLEVRGQMGPEPELLHALSLSEKDAACGRVAPIAETFGELHAALDTLERKG